mgnify:FL=1
MPSGTRISAADNFTPGGEAGIPQALSLMVEALRLLDRNHGPPDVCAHLDLAINRLQAMIDKGNGVAD